MIVASFGPTTGWLGKAISFENGQFILEDYGPIAATDVMEYDRQGHLVWANGETRSWVASGAATPAPHPAVASGDIVAESHLLQAHEDSVTSIAVTSDGRRAVTASRDASIRLWDLGSFELLRTFDASLPTTPEHPYGNWIRCVTLTPDGRRVVAGSDDGLLRVWDLETGASLLSLPGHEWFIGGVAVTPDGRRVVSASHDKTLKVWDLDTGVELMTLLGHEDAVNAVVITPDGRLAVSASSDKTLKVWDLATGALVRTLRGHEKVANAIAITADGLGIVSGAGDRSIRLWEILSGTEVRSMVGHRWAVESIAVTPDGRLAISGCNDGTIIAWELASGRQVRTFAGRQVVDEIHGQGIDALAMTPDGRVLLSGSGDHTLRSWALPEPGPALIPPALPESLFAGVGPTAPAAAAEPTAVPVAVPAATESHTESWTAAFVLDAVREALASVPLTEATVDALMRKTRPAIRIMVEGLTPVDFRDAVHRLTAEGYVDIARMDLPPQRPGRWMDTGQLVASDPGDPRLDLVIDGIGDRRLAEGGTKSFVLSAVDISIALVTGLTAPLKEDRIKVALHVTPSDVGAVLEALERTSGRPPGGGFALDACFAADRTAADRGRPAGSYIEVE